jgi:hypothetical protein
MEIWKDIKGYEGLYQVSNLGRVKSMQRKVYNATGYRNVRERILKSAITTSGYYNINVGVNNSKPIHRLVAVTFISNPNNYPNVLHNDNDTSNNSVSNLRWGTQKHNMQQMHDEGRHKIRRK